MVTNFINMLVMAEKCVLNHALCDCDWGCEILIFIQNSEVA